MIMALTVSVVSAECLLEGAMCAIAIFSGKKLKKVVLNN